RVDVAGLRGAFRLDARVVEHANAELSAAPLPAVRDARDRRGVARRDRPAELGEERVALREELPEDAGVEAGLVVAVERAQRVERALVDAVVGRRGRRPVHDATAGESRDASFARPRAGRTPRRSKARAPSRSCASRRTAAARSTGHSGCGRATRAIASPGRTTPS